MALRDWNPFSTRSRDSPGASPALLSALGDLDRLSAARPELTTAAKALTVILTAAFSTEVAAVDFEVDPELLRAGWREGVPACRVGDHPPSLDRDDLKARGLAILDAIPAESPDAAPLRAAVRQGRADLARWASEILCGRAGVVEQDAEALGVGGEFVRSVLNLALLPALDGLSRRLAPLRVGVPWQLGLCPTCGEAPTLAESRGLEQRRYYRCSRCAGDWEAERFRCHSCGETDHRRLSYDYYEGEQDRFRLIRCESCGGTLKLIATLAAISAPGLLVAELASSHLDCLVSRAAS